MAVHVSGLSRSVRAGHVGELVGVVLGRVVDDADVEVLRGGDARVALRTEEEAREAAASLDGGELDGVRLRATAEPRGEERRGDERPKGRGAAATEREVYVPRHHREDRDAYVPRKEAYVPRDERDVRLVDGVEVDEFGRALRRPRGGHSWSQSRSRSRSRSRDRSRRRQSRSCSRDRGRRRERRRRRSPSSSSSPSSSRSR